MKKKTHSIFNNLKKRKILSFFLNFFFNVAGRKNSVWYLGLAKSLLDNNLEVQSFKLNITKCVELMGTFNCIKNHINLKCMVPKFESLNQQPPVS